MVDPILQEVSKGEVDYIKNIVHPRTRDYIGDILVIKSKCWQARLIQPFTGEYNHVAMRTHPNLATGISPDGLEKYILSKPPEEWNSYVMVRDKRLTDKDRQQIKRMNKTLSTKYDLKLLLKLGFMQMMYLKPDDVDMSGDGFSCSSRPARLSEILFSHSVIDGVHSSQVRPSMYLESPYFDIIKEWKR